MTTSNSATDTPARELGVLEYALRRLLDRRPELARVRVGKVRLGNEVTNPKVIR
jgi:hypothetical protein